MASLRAAKNGNFYMHFRDINTHAMYVSHAL